MISQSQNLRPRTFARAGWGLAMAISLACTALITGILSGNVCHAQDEPSFQDLLKTGKKKAGKSVPRVTWQARFAQENAQPGDEVTLEVTAKIIAEHHIYSLTQKDGAQPTVIKLEGAECLDISAAKFEADHAPKQVEDAGLSGEKLILEKYHDEVTFRTPLKVTAENGCRTAKVSLTISYSVCDTMNCFLTQPVELTAELPLTGSPSTPATTSPAQAGRGAPDPVPEVRSADGKRIVYEQFAAKDAPSVARWWATVQPKVVTPGGEVTVAVHVDLDPGWHTYALHQRLNKDGEGLMRTGLQLILHKGLTPVQKSFVGPAPHEAPSEGFEGLIERSHTGRTSWTYKLKVPASQPAGPIELLGRAAFQVCHKSCLLPMGFDFAGQIQVGEKADPASDFLPVVAELESDKADEFVTNLPEVRDEEAVLSAMTRGASAPGRSKPEVAVSAPAPKGEKPTEKAEGAAGSVDKSKGLFLFLLTAFGAGLTALLTPCVFPMVPITVSFFLKQAEKEHHHPLSMAIVYCLGIIGTFTGLGILLSVLFGANFITQVANNAWLNIGIAAMLIFFGLNMLGLFEIGVPSWLLTMAAGQQDRGGYIGVLFMALTFTLTSFTCTFAFAGTLLVLATQGDWLWPILGLLTFSLAFSLPFFFLALFPSQLKKLPKSGGWMNTVKVTMGMLELGAAFKFLSVADLSFNPVPLLFDAELILSTWIVICACTGMYLLGLFRTNHDTPVNGISVPRLVVAMSFLGLGAYMTTGMLSTKKPEGQLWQNVVAFLPPTFESGTTELGPVLKSHDLEYALDLEKALKVAIAQKKPLFLDFTGVNCTNCRLMERGTLASKEIHDRLKDFVRVQVFMDKVPVIKDRDEVSRLRKLNAMLGEQWFGEVSMPSYAVVEATPDSLKDDSHILSRVSGLTDVNTFAQFLDTGLAEWKKRRHAVALVEQK